MTNDIKPLLFSLADAIGADLIPKGNYTFEGKRKAVLELFEGYSPTVVSSIETSLVDYLNSVVGAQMHVFGNLGIIVVVEGQQSHVSAFVYDRSKAVDGEFPFDSHWSRNKLHQWLEGCCKAVYHRSLFDTVWDQLPEPAQRLIKYNKSRKNGLVSAKVAYNDFWGLTNATD